MPLTLHGGCLHFDMPHDLIVHCDWHSPQNHEQAEVSFEVNFGDRRCLLTVFVPLRRVAHSSLKIPEKTAGVMHFESAPEP